MVALNPLFVSTSDLEEYLVDKDTGLPLANGLIYFYRAAAPNVLKPVYQISGTFPSYTYTALPNPMILSAVGTTQNAGGDNVDILYYPWLPDYNPLTTPTPTLDLYYIVVTDQNGVPQFTRDPWPPNLTPATSPVAESDNMVTNQIANPTFTNTFLNPGIPNNITVTGATLQQVPIAPDWFLEISGTGTVTVQVIPLMGSQNVPGYPPYMLDVLVGAGITVCNIVQRFYNNSGLWASISDTNQTFLYGAVTAYDVLPTGSVAITMYYRESTVAYIPQVIFTATFPQQPYQQYSGTSSAIPMSADPISGQPAYVDIYISLTPVSHVQVSAIQVIPLPALPSGPILPDYESSNRNEALQGDYYLPRAITKQIDSFLTGWDFPLNPGQFGTSGTIQPQLTAMQPQCYIVDQTIALAATTAVPWQRDPITNGLQFMPSGSGDAFYVLQYLSGQNVDDILTSDLAVNIYAYLGSAGAPVTMQVYLFVAPPAVSPATTNIPVLPATIGTVGTDGTFTLTVSAVAAGWTAITRGGLPTPQVTLNYTTEVGQISSGQDFGFSGWKLSAAQIATMMGATNTNYFAMVVTFAYGSGGPVITLNSASLVPGDLPCRPAVKTFDETLRQCQYYYETSYDVGVQPSATSIGSVIYETTFTATGSTGANGNTDVYARMIHVDYKTIKRLTITPTFYPIDFIATSNLATLQIYNGSTLALNTDVPVVTTAMPPVIGNWTLTDNSTSSYKLFPIDWSASIYHRVGVTNPGGPSTAINSQCFVRFQYSADCRLGIV